MESSPFVLVLLGAAVTALSTGLGAIPALAARTISEKTQDTLIGFSAGVMLAAASFSLIIPALETMSGSGNQGLGALWVGLFILLGAMFLHVLNRLIPHEHFFSGKEGGVSSTKLKRIWLFVLAITLHNFPEGLAVGTGIGSHSFEIALPILIGIGLQDIPEGFVVAMALVSAKYSGRHAVGVAALTGLVEALAAFIGYFAMVTVTALLPWALALSGGAMLYVVSNEMIPESHRKEHASYATCGLMIGFVTMMILDTALT